MKLYLILPKYYEKIRFGGKIEYLNQLKVIWTLEQATEIQAYSLASVGRRLFA